MNKIYWFTSSYRKKEAKFQNDLLNEEKSEVSASGLLLQSGLCDARAHGPQAHDYRLEAFSQSNVPSTTLDVGRRFVVAVFNYHLRTEYV